MRSIPFWRVDFQFDWLGSLFSWKASFRLRACIGTMNRWRFGVPALAGPSCSCRLKAGLQTNVGSWKESVAWWGLLGKDFVVQTRIGLKALVWVFSFASLAPFA